VHTTIANALTDGNVPEFRATRNAQNAKKGNSELYDVINLLVLTTISNELIDGHVPENADT
jgi:hypothetical protein